MTDPQLVTATGAADPTIPLQLLADVAARRPDLRAVVAANPAAYPALLDWLASLGDPDVDAALRARAAEGAPAAPTVVGGGGFAPLGAAGTTVTEPAAPYLPVPRPEPYTQPGGAYYPPTSTVSGYPTGTASGYPTSSSVTPFGSVAPSYGAPAPWEAPRKSSNKVLWIALGVIGVLFVAAIGLIVVVAMTASGAAGYGDDPRMDAFHDACAAGDMQSCDDLYMESPWGSEYEDFGNTCGGRTAGLRYCTEENFG